MGSKFSALIIVRVWMVVGKNHDVRTYRKNFKSWTFCFENIVTKVCDCDIKLCKMYKIFKHERLIGMIEVRLTVSVHVEPLLIGRKSNQTALLYFFSRVWWSKNPNYCNNIEPSKWQFVSIGRLDKGNGIEFPNWSANNNLNNARLNFWLSKTYRQKNAVPWGIYFHRCARWR